MLRGFSLRGLAMHDGLDIGIGAPRVGRLRSPLERRCDAILDSMATTFAGLTGERPSGLREDLHIATRATLVDVISSIGTQGMAAHQAKNGAPTPGAAMSWLQRKASEGMARMMAARVLGIYVPASQSVSRRGLYVIEDNVAAIAGQTGIEPGALLEHVVTHEAVHQWQDRNRPWVAGHLQTLQAKAMQHTGIADLVHARGDLTKVNPVMEQLNAVMGLMEGHAEFMADAILSANGRNRGVGALLNSRREGPPKNPLMAMVLDVTGLSGKLRQYGEGYRFCQQVTDFGGIALLQHAWDGPSTLPSAAEIADPALWLTRMSAGGGSAAVWAA